MRRRLRYTQHRTSRVTLQGTNYHVLTGSASASVLGLDVLLRPVPVDDRREPSSPAERRLVFFSLRSVPMPTASCSKSLSALLLTLPPPLEDEEKVVVDEPDDEEEEEESLCLLLGELLLELRWCWR